MKKLANWTLNVLTGVGILLILCCVQVEPEDCE